jgi:hypothetical protein
VEAGERRGGSLGVLRVRPSARYKRGRDVVEVLLRLPVPARQFDPHRQSRVDHNCARGTHRSTFGQQADTRRVLLRRDGRHVRAADDDPVDAQALQPGLNSTGDGKQLLDDIDVIGRDLLCVRDTCVTAGVIEYAKRNAGRFGVTMLTAIPAIRTASM